jgi:Tol biopolymer transport system component
MKINLLLRMVRPPSLLTPWTGIVFESYNHVQSNPEGWHPRWSPDGKHIAFLSDRDETTDDWVMSPLGGDVERVTDVEGGMSALAASALDTQAESTTN